MISNNTDKEWEKLGKTQPYFGVISHDSYAKENLNPEAIKRFFDTGEEYIRMILGQIASHVAPGFQPKSALDFGCGVGRLVVPLAARCERAVGIDVSQSMLAEAEKNCRERGLDKVEFRTSLDALGEARFDFINTFIVMQHIALKNGTPLFRKLVSHLAPGGCGAIHLTYHADVSRKGAVAAALRKRFQAFNILFNLMRGLPAGTPFMQMNSYDLNLAQWELQKAGCTEFHSLFTYHGGYAGQILLFRKPAAPESLKA